MTSRRRIRRSLCTKQVTYCILPGIFWHLSVMSAPWGRNFIFHPPERCPILVPKQSVCQRFALTMQSRPFLTWNKTAESYWNQCADTDPWWYSWKAMMNSSQTLEEQTRFSAFGHQSQRFATLRLPDKVRLLEYGWDARKKHKWVKHSQKCEKPGLPLPQFQFWQYQILFLKIFMISGIPIDISSWPSKRNECTCFGLQGNQQIDDLVISQGSWLPSLEWFHLQKCIPKESTSNPSERSGCCSRPEPHFSCGCVRGQITSRIIHVYNSCRK